MKNKGKVKSDSSGADRTVAAPMIPSTTGKNNIDRTNIGIVDFLRCFLSDTDVIRRVKTKYNLLINWKNLSLESPMRSDSIGTP